MFIESFKLTFIVINCIWNSKWKKGGDPSKTDLELLKFSKTSSYELLTKHSEHKILTNEFDVLL